MRLIINGNRTYMKLAVLLAVILLVPGIASAQEQQISEIKVMGNDHVSTDAILAAIAIKPGTVFSEQAIQEAKQAIESMGYFQPGVTAGIESLPSGVRLVFNVVENPMVKEIKITGNTVVTTEKLLSLMRTAVETVLNANTFLQDTKAIEDYYYDLGYSAYVTEEGGIDPQTGILSIPLMEMRIEDIRITGIKKTKSFVILREMEQKPGEVYNRKALFRDLQRIYDLEIFDRENIEPYKVDAGSDLGKVIITIPVKERKTGEVSVGLAYDSKRGIGGQAKLTESNFLGRAQKVNLMWEQSGNRGSSYEAGFFEPWLDSNHTSLGINVYDKLIFRFSNSAFVGTDEDYDERRQGGSFTLSRPFGYTNRGFVTLRSETVDTGTSSNLPISSNGNVTSGTFRFTNATRDSEIDPLTGGYNSGAVELGTASFKYPIDKTTFTKYSVDLRRYFSKGGPRKEFNERRKVLAVRLMAGSLSGDVPFFEQYFIGGAEALRGYNEDRFWGPNMLLASAEFRFPMGSSLTGVVFTDYGDAWGAKTKFRETSTGEELIQDFTQHEDFSGNLGYGLGVRLQTPIGPLRLDYGFGDEGSRAHFSIGHVF